MSRSQSRQEPPAAVTSECRVMTGVLCSREFVPSEYLNDAAKVHYREEAASNRLGRSLISLRGLIKDVSSWNSLFSMRRAARLY